MFDRAACYQLLLSAHFSAPGRWGHGAKQSTLLIVCEIPRYFFLFFIFFSFSSRDWYNTPRPLHQSVLCTHVFLYTWTVYCVLFVLVQVYKFFVVLLRVYTVHFYNADFRQHHNFLAANGRTTQDRTALYTATLQHTWIHCTKLQPTTLVLCRLQRSLSCPLTRE